MIYIGIDPGKSGGIAILDEASGIECIPMPEFDFDLYDVLEALPALPRVHAVLEKVHAMPKQGVTSSFNFGVEYGRVRMALCAAGIGFEEVTPQKWMKELGIPPKKKQETKGQYKNRLRDTAQKMFPKLEVWKGPKGLQMAICDALLIMEYCRRTHE